MRTEPKQTLPHIDAVRQLSSLILLKMEVEDILKSKLSSEYDIPQLTQILKDGVEKDFIRLLKKGHKGGHKK